MTGAAGTDQGHTETPHRPRSTRGIWLVMVILVSVTIVVSGSIQGVLWLLGDGPENQMPRLGLALGDPAVELESYGTEPAGLYPSYSFDRKLLAYTLDALVAAQRGETDNLDTALLKPTPRLFQRLAACRKVRRLRLPSRTRDRDLESLQDLEELMVLEFANDDPEQVLTGAGCRHLAGLPGLIDLQLPRHSVTDEGLEGLAELEHLRRLNVISRLVTSRGVAAIAASPSAPRLEYLKIAQARVGDEIVPLLLKCQQLKVLDLYGTQLTDRGLSQLHRLPRLTCLRIAETPVTHTGIQDLLRLRPGLYVDNAP